MTRTVPTRDAAADDGSHAIADPCWSARPTGTAVMLIVTSLVSLAATIIIMVERAILTADPTYVTSCDINPWLSCGRVMQSWQAMTFGFPNPLIGLVAFPMLITVGTALLAGGRFARWFWVLLNIGLVGGGGGGGGAGAAGGGGRSYGGGGGAGGGGFEGGGSGFEGGGGVPDFDAGGDDDIPF